MSLIPGDKLGPYEILAPLGAGGMGEIYRARDTRLDRTVAIKVLPDHIAKRDDLRARFEREARAVGSLNHPNICVLHDLGNQDGAGYMVMEYMEGETLAERIAKGPIPIDQALKQATQIADALDRAHRAGVIHRDIKPQNIMLTRDGVKVLDFGLAKSTSTPGPSDATLTDVLTTEGTVMGTPQYMAPEQFEGREADARVDIWAFGAVLYEMLTGQKAFQGKSYSSLVGAIMSADPAPMAVKPFTPSWLERLVRRCLNKDPERRYQSMRDVVLDLEIPPAEVIVAPVQTSRLLWSGMATACLLVAIAGWSPRFWNSGEPGEPVKLEVNPPDGSRFTPLNFPGGSAISPDGRTLAFNATNAEGVSLIYLRPLKSLQGIALAGTEGAGRPFWSPDSKSLAFVAGGKLKRIELSGTSVTLCEAQYSRGGAWNKDGVILFGNQNSGLRRISASGGSPVAVTHPDGEAGEGSHFNPQFLPGGNDFIFLATSLDREKTGVFVGSLAGKPPTRLLRTEYMAVFDASAGRLLYIQGDGSLMARHLQLNPPMLTGDPEILSEKVGLSHLGRYANLSISSDGTMFYGREEAQESRLQWRDRKGKASETIGQPVDNLTLFYLSPDGSRIAYSAGANNRALWVQDLARGVSTRVTLADAMRPRWSADGKQLYYRNLSGIYRKAADGSGEEELVLKLTSPGFPQSLSPDGRHLLFGFGDILNLSLTSDRKQTTYLQSKYLEDNATYSPDGRWVAYNANEAGQFNVYVQGFPKLRTKWTVSPAGGTSPQWRADGKELYWIGSDRTLMAVSVEMHDAEIRLGRAEPLFPMPGSGYQPSRDGRRFLVAQRESSDQRVPSMVIVQNWAARVAK